MCKMMGEEALDKYRNYHNYHDYHNHLGLRVQLILNHVP